jgi:hypothetical protein
MTNSDWFKYSAEKLEKSSRSAYSPCWHFDSSQIGATKAEREKLRLWKKNCGFCKVLKRRRSEESEKEESGSDDEKLPQHGVESTQRRKIQHVPVTSPVQQPPSWIRRLSSTISSTFSSFLNSDVTGTHFDPEA